MSIESGKAKAAELRAQMERYACGRRAAKVNRLNAASDAGDKAASATLKAMRIDRHGSPAPSAGDLWNPKGKRLAKGSSNKHNSLLRGQRARNNQAKGI